MCVVNCWILQIIWQCVPDCWLGARESTASKRVGGEHVKQTVDDVWQITNAGDQELQTQHTIVGKVKTTMDRHGELVLQPLRNSQPVQVIMQ